MFENETKKTRKKEISNCSQVASPFKLNVTDGQKVMIVGVFFFFLFCFVLFCFCFVLFCFVLFCFVLFSPF